MGSKSGAEGKLQLDAAELGYASFPHTFISCVPVPALPFNLLCSIAGIHFVLVCVRRRLVLPNRR
jgi:hypothetical protein